ncbi:TetR/AcrR family transcriptional regulator [Streptomyces beigongshangae]|uniref:TetR/AcrR family transcriptional regulator n=1 Tax=Streptomyces beigongshangae TaxID=2841597 RepID=UPI001C843197|nr:TetR/AcrR family transcriptional regulator [Streptomyces sp. REN17]
MQERATRTRQALVLAAASEFDRHGYAGTSLVQVCKVAGATTGALTFHFRGKSELADAVQADGCAAVRRAVEPFTGPQGPALERIVELTLSLTRLLQDDPIVRSSARLNRERPDSGFSWAACWLPTVGELARRAQRTGQLRAGTRIDAVTYLAACLLLAAEMRVRASLQAARDPDAVQQLERMWDLALHGLLP